jgi:hypothetical protein
MGLVKIEGYNNPLVLWAPRWSASYNNPLCIGIVVGRQLQHPPGSGLPLGRSS